MKKIFHIDDKFHINKNQIKLVFISKFYKYNNTFNVSKHKIFFILI